jgi:hypothetical protein
VIRALDFKPGFMQREGVGMIRAEIAAWAADPLAAHALAEMCEAATGHRAPGNTGPRLEWVEETLEAAFRHGDLILVRDTYSYQRPAAGGGAAAPGGSGQTGAAGAGSKKKAGASADADEPLPPRPAAEKTWFRARLLDEDGEPMKGEDYVLVDSEGARREGKLDENGEIYIPPILPPGKCKISFPKMHLNPRKRK